jgi:hypothetical protein
MYIPTIELPILLQENMWIFGRIPGGIYKSLTDTRMWKLELRPRKSFPGIHKWDIHSRNGEPKVANRFVHHQQTDGWIKTKHSQVIGAEQLSRRSTMLNLLPLPSSENYGQFGLLYHRYCMRSYEKSGCFPFYFKKPDVFPLLAVQASLSC